MARNVGRIASQFRIDIMIYKKIKALAKIERRPVNNQIEYILDLFIRKYESDHGPIEITEDEPED